MELNTSLRSILEDSTVIHYYHILDKILQCMDELRDNLRISRKINLKDSSPNDIDIDDVLVKLKRELVKMRVESRKRGEQY